jgi:hypothetical protein
MTEFRFYEAKPAFLPLTEAEIWEAINKNDDSNIAAEVTRLACLFWERFRKVARQGHAPPHVTRISVQCPIERVAVIIMLGYIEAEVISVPRMTRH